jgi:molybdate transport system substrate-binding protein
MFLTFFSIFTPVQAALSIAVASNFKVSAVQIAQQFKDKYSIDVSVSSASTATLYQQILRGAPFDLFLSADQEHVNLLKKANKTVGQDDFIYAQGRLVFWQPSAAHTPTEQDFIAYKGRLAIANPKFAPYGIAAQQALEFNHKWQEQQYIQGNNINQAYQFVASKNVTAGLVSYAAVVQEKQNSYFLIPNEWHQALVQSGVILKGQKLTAQKILEANLFRDFLLSPEIQTQIQAQGYN